MAALYKGFSFKNWQRTKSFVLTDVELVKQDLINHIHTRKIERVGHREFGTIIHDLLFEPFDNNTVVLITDQVRSVINFDPRVVILQEEDFFVQTDLENGSLIIAVRLFFIELDVSNVLHLNLIFNG